MLHSLCYKYFCLILQFGMVRLKDSVDLLESMEQKGLLDMNKVVTCSNSPFFSVYLLLFPDFHVLSDPPC